MNIAPSRNVGSGGRFAVSHAEAMTPATQKRAAASGRGLRSRRPMWIREKADAQATTVTSVAPTASCVLKGAGALVEGSLIVWGFF